MKRKVYNKETLSGIERSTGFWLHVSVKSGKIRLSADLMKKMSGGALQFVQNEDKPNEWFIEPSKDQYAIKPVVFDCKKKGKAGTIYSTQLAKEILKSCKLDFVATKFLVGCEIEEGSGYPIITKSAKQ